MRRNGKDQPCQVGKTKARVKRVGRIPRASLCQVDYSHLKFAHASGTP